MFMHACFGDELMMNFVWTVLRREMHNRGKGISSGIKIVQAVSMGKGAAFRSYVVDG